MNKTKEGFPIWDEEFDREHFTPEEIAETDMQVAIITALVKARHEQEMFREKRRMEDDGD